MSSRRLESIPKGASPAEARRYYPSRPSPRFSEAREENAKAARKAAAAAGAARVPSRPPAVKPRDPFEGLKRLHGGHIGHSHPVPSGACAFFRKDCDVKEALFPGVTAELVHPGGVPLGDVQRRLEASGQDLPCEELPSLANAFVASAAGCIRAGRYPLAGALSARLKQLDGEPVQLHPAQVTTRAPATARIIREQCDLPQRLHSVATATRPAAPLSLNWIACSKGARLMYSKTTAVRDVEKSVTIGDSVLPGYGHRKPDDQDSGAGALRCRHTWAHLQPRRELSPQSPAHEHSAEATEPAQAVDPAARPMRLRQKWPRALAVGPASAIVSRLPEGKYFETTVELAAQAREHFMSRVHDAAGPGQRPLLHIGVTTAAPPEGAEEVLDEPYTSGGQCWLISTGGHVYSEGVHRCTTSVTWPQFTPKESDLLPVRPLHGVRLGLLVTDAGSLQLYVNGALAAISPPDTMPRALAWGTGLLFPMVALGPNIRRVTLCPPT